MRTANRTTASVFVVQRLLGAGNEKTPARVSSRQLKPVTEHLCPVCGGRFTEPTDLAVHLGKIHNIKTEIVDVADVFSVDSTVTNDQLSLADNLALQLYREQDLHTSPALSVK